MWKIQSFKQLLYPVNPGAGLGRLPLQHLHPEVKKETLAVDQKREKGKGKVDERVHLRSPLRRKEAGRIHNPLLVTHLLDRWRLNDKSTHPPM